MLDVSREGAKLIADMSATIPGRFEIAFTQGSARAVC
jgi:hypothetical protein